MRALDRVTAILEAVSSTPSGTNLTTIASLTGLSMPTTSRLVRTLEARDLLERQGTSRLYVIGSRLLAIATAAGGRPRIVETAIGPMAVLRDRSGETVSLHMRVGNERVCIAEVQSTKEVRRVVPVGLSLPLHYGATGEVLLANLPEGFRNAYLGRLALEPVARKSLTDRLSLIRDRGWSMASDSWSEGLAGVATSLRSPEGTVYSLSVSGPSSRLTVALMTKVVTSLQATGAAIMAALGAEPAPTTARSIPVPTD